MVVATAGSVNRLTRPSPAPRVSGLGSVSASIYAGEQAWLTCIDDNGKEVGEPRHFARLLARICWTAA